MTENELQILKCPHCKGEHLHHIEVKLFNRKEDSSKGLYIKSVVEQPLDDLGFRTTPMQDGVEIKTILPIGNPSARRSGMIVYFYCEECGKKSRFSLAQHKGSTYMTHLDFAEI